MTRSGALRGLIPLLFVAPVIVLALVALAHSQSTEIKNLAGTWRGTAQDLSGVRTPWEVVVREDGTFQWSQGAPDPRSGVGTLMITGDAIVFALGQDRGVVTISESGRGRRQMSAQISGTTDQGFRYGYSAELEFVGRTEAKVPGGVRVAQTSPQGSQPGTGSDDALTNEAVVAMVRAGLSERIIIAKIRSSRRSFDTSSNALIKLKGANVPEAVIEAMLSVPEPGQVSSASPAPSLPPVQTAPPQGPPAGTPPQGPPYQPVPRGPPPAVTQYCARDPPVRFSFYARSELPTSIPDTRRAR